MNDHDWDIIERGLDRPMTPYEKVLAKRDFKKRVAQETEEKFDWFVKRSMGEFYNYRPWEDDD